MQARRGQKTISELSIFTTQTSALYNQSFAGKPPGLRRLKKDRFPLAPCLSVLSASVSLTQTRDCSFLPWKAKHGQSTHGTASPPVFLPSRAEQHFSWFTEPPQSGLFLELISFHLLHLFLLSTTSNHPEWTSPLIYHQSSLHEGSFCRGPGELLLPIASSEASSIISAMLLHSAKGSGPELWLQSPLFPLHRFSRWPRTYSPWCLSSSRSQQEELPWHGSPFAIHELALTTPLQSQKIC